MDKEYPDPLTPEQRKRYEAACEEIRESMKAIHEEIEASTRLTAADYAVTINAR